MYKFIQACTKPGDVQFVCSRLEVMAGVEEVGHDPGSDHITVQVRSGYDIIETIKADPGVYKDKVKYV